MRCCLVSLHFAPLSFYPLVSCPSLFLKAQKVAKEGGAADVQNALATLGETLLLSYTAKYGKEYRFTFGGVLMRYYCASSVSVLTRRFPTREDKYGHTPMENRTNRIVSDGLKLALVFLCVKGVKGEIAAVEARLDCKMV